MADTEERLANLERTCDRTLHIVETLSDHVAKRVELDDAWRERTDLILMGDGNGRKGHNVRIDRLEQSQARNAKLFWSLGVPLVLLASKELVKLLG